MTDRHDQPARNGAGTKSVWLTRWRGVLLALAALVCASTVAQVADPAPPQTYCYSRIGVGPFCSTTLEQAEAVMRADPFFKGAGDVVEHYGTALLPPSTVRLQYAIADRPAESIGIAAYWGDFGAFGNSQGKCALSDDQTGLPGWCASEDGVNAIARAEIQDGFLSCILGPTTLESEYSEPVLQAVFGTTRGRVDYSTRRYKVELRCSDTESYTKEWRVLKQRPFYCRTGFNVIGTAVSDATLAQDYLCEPDEDDIVRIDTPLQQCGSCAGSPNPTYPATGEKRRAETDFEFAGEVFTRHYRSLRQFRPNRRFAVAWTHTWSDRIITGSATPYAYINEAGDYEGYDTLSVNLYRGDNSLDQVLQRVNADGIGWRLRMADGEVREFDLDGYLIKVRHPDDPLNDVTIAYAFTNKSISTVTDAQGRVLRFFYADNILQRIVLPDGSEYVYGHDADRNLTSVLNPDWSMRFYHYNETGLAGAATQRHHLTGITDEMSQRFASFAYDAYGRVISSELSGTPAEQTEVNYPGPNAAVVHTASGGSDTYAIQSGPYRRILNRADSEANVTLTYDSLGRVESSTDKRNVTTEFEYVGAYRTATIEAVGTPEERREEIDRDPVSGRVIEQRIRNAAGTLKAKTVWTYNARHQALTVSAIDPVTLAARTATMAYCEQLDVTNGACPLIGLLKSIDGPRSDVVDTVTYTYRMADEPTCAATPTTCPYRMGDLWKTTNALTQTVEIVKTDGAGRPKSIVDENGVTTDLEYNARGWPSAQKTRGTNAGSESDDRITRLWYTPFGAIKRVLQPDGMETVFSYDEGQRLSSVGDNRGNLIVYTLNAAGQPVGEDVIDSSGALRRSLERTYDTLGRLDSQLDAYDRSTGFAYDFEGNPKRITDALGRKTDHDIDPLGRIIRTVQDVDSLAVETGFVYDTLDRLERITDPKGLHTDYDYNGFDDVVQLDSPDTGISTYGYDPAGNLVTTTDDRNVTTDHTYDALSRLVTVDHPGTAEDVVFAYDTAPADCAAGETFHTGRLASMTDASGSTTWCYNRFGDLVRKVQRTSGQTLTLQWNVLANGRLASMTYPDGTVVDYVRDTLGRTTGIGATPAGGTRQSLLGSAIYHPFGPVARWTYGTGRTMSRTLNLNHEPGIVQVTAMGGISIGYQFDEVGNLETLRDGNQSEPPLRSYHYDRLNRLTEERDGATDALLHAYTYDDTGNRMSRTAGPTTETYAYAPTSHRLQSVAGIARGYDAVGNTTAIGGTAREFVYNHAGRMASAKANGVQTASYLYNGDGERVLKTTSAQTVVTLYDGAGQWLGDYDSSGQPLQQAIWFGELPVGLLAGAGAAQKLHYIEADALNTPRVIVDPVANVAVWRWDLIGDAFGDTTPNEDPDNNGIAFIFDMRSPGQRYDAATGLYYNYFRDYDPDTGRYAQSDPIGLDGGINTYGYANGSPLVYSDPDGLAGRGGIGGRVGKVLGRPLAKGFDKLIGRSPGARAAYAARLQARMHAHRLARDAKIAARIAKGNARRSKNPPGCDSIAKSPTDFQGHYIPLDKVGNPVPLAHHTTKSGVRVPLPDPAAVGPHTTIGSRLASDGQTLYRQTATFPGNTWPRLNGQNVPWGRVDWTSHAYLRGGSHPSPHIHEFLFNSAQGTWMRLPGRAFFSH